MISDNKKIKEVQVAFNEKFPYLKIEFYSAHHEPGHGTPVVYKLSDSKTIGEVRTRHEEGDLTVEGDMLVQELETALENKFGLHAQVFRKSGAMWLQTTSTDQWTLAEQNRKGGHSEEAFIEKYGS